MKWMKSGKLHIKIPALVISLVMVLCEAAFAEGLEVTPEKNRIPVGDSIIVNVSGAQEEEQVTILVYGETVNQSEIKSSDILYMNQKKSDADGKSTFTFPLPDETPGVRIVSIASESSDSILTKDVTIVNGTHTITFTNYNDEVLSTVEVDDGEKPVYDGTEPKRPDENGYSYSFSGWYPALTEALDDAVYKATYTATKKKYTVTFDSNGGSTVENVIVEHGEKVTKPSDPTRTDYDFDKWTKDGAEYDFNTPVTEAITLTAQWAIKQYTVKKSAGIVNGDVTLSAESGKAGDTITVQVDPDATYKLSLLTVIYTNAEGEQSENITSDKLFTVPSGVIGDITVTPVFVQKAVDSIVLTPASTNIKRGTSGDFVATIYASEADGKTDLTDVYKDDLAWTMVVADEADGTEITVDSGDRSKATLSVGVTQSKDNTITVKAVIGDKNGTATVTVTDEDVYAVNIPDALQPYISVDKGSAAENAEITITVTEKNGYRIKDGTLKVTKSGNAEVPVSDGKFTMPAEEVTISAELEKITYTLTNGKTDTNTETNGGGYLTLSSAAGDVLYDTAVTVTVHPNTGYELATLSVGGEDVTSSVAEGAYTFNMPATATEVTATFRAKSFLLTKVPSTGGSYEVSGITFGVGNTALVAYGTELTISPTPGAGYEVDTVTVTKTGDENTELTLNNNSFTMPDYPVTVSLTFKKINYTITTSTENGTITVTDNKATANKDDEITFTVNPDEGYELKANSVKVNGGSVDVSESDGTYSFTMPAGNVTITVEFEPVIPVDEKEYLTLLDTFDAVLQIEKTAGENGSVVLTAEAKADNTPPTLNLYVAIYNSDNSLKSVSLIPFAAANDDYKASLTKPTLESGESFKVMLWTDRYEPVIGVISSEDFFN